MTSADLLLHHANLFEPESGVSGADAVAVQDGAISWIGLSDDAPQARQSIDCAGRLVTPGLIDCHTHLVYGGHRAREFELRLEGASYEQIAREGGGILSTVTATRTASRDELREHALTRLDALCAEGVTTVEIKSGYGLDHDTEIRCLEVARSLAEARDVDVATTYLGAHALPPEFREDREGYLDLVIHRVLPEIAERGLATAVDAFCEGIAFTPDEVERVFRAAVDLGLDIKVHAEQLSDLGGAARFAALGALSADHLEYLSREDAATLGRHGTVAVLLPGAFYTLRETKKPPVEALRGHGVPMAIATDCNPGSSPLQSPLLAMNMACTLFGLTPTEAVRGMTEYAARALGMQDRGRLAVGLRADLVLWTVRQAAELPYQLGGPRVDRVVFEGHERSTVTACA